MNEQQQFLADAERVREEQLERHGSSYEVDPAIQAGIDHAIETAGSGPEPGSQAPGFMGLGGLSKADVQAQQEDIAQRSRATGTP